MIKNIIWTVILSTIAVILESAFLYKISIFNVTPDLSLCILVFSAYVNGTMTGQVSGFFSGLLRDFLSSAPLGLNCLVRTLIGAITGIFKGSLFLDFFFMPVILCSLATIAKVGFLFYFKLYYWPFSAGIFIYYFVILDRSRIKRLERAFVVSYFKTVKVFIFRTEIT